MRRIKKICRQKMRVLFLGYDETQTTLINLLLQEGFSVFHTRNKLESLNGYDYIISYGYRHILPRDLIEGCSCSIINLHIAYLPFNRGAHPNFWSFYDDTPSGVTIHIVDGGIDTGPIICQERVKFTEFDDTFQKTFEILKSRIEALFRKILPALISGSWASTPQNGGGTHHYVGDLPSNFSGWNANIKNEIDRLKREGLKYE